jgi:hypothetical protein
MALMNLRSCGPSTALFGVFALFMGFWAVWAYYYVHRQELPVCDALLPVHLETGIF